MTRLYLSVIVFLLGGSHLISIAKADPTPTVKSVVGPYGRYDTYDDFPSQTIAPRKITVFIPDGPADPDGYAVLYMHDGRNVFDPVTAMAHEPWAADRAVSESRMALIIVAIDNTPLRWSEYVPLNVFQALGETLQTAAQGQEAAPLSDRYIDFIADELKPFIDRQYPTRRDAAHTFIAGSSMGGLISIYAMERRPEVFGRAAGLSTHWPATTNFLLFGHDPASADPALTTMANRAADVLADDLPDPWTHRLWVDHGDQTLDQYYAGYAARFTQRAASRGWKSSLVSKVYPGTAHNEASWRARFPEVLEFFYSP